MCVMSEERDSEAEYVRQTETDTIGRVEVTGKRHTVHRRDTSEERDRDSNVRHERGERQ